MEFFLYTNLEQLPESADALFVQGEKNSMFFSRPWIESLEYTTNQDSNNVYFACVEDAGKVLAILPLVKCSGNDYHSLTHKYASLYSLLLADRNSHQIITCLVNGLSASRFNSLLLEPVSENDQRINHLQRCLQASGYACHRYFRFYNWVLKVYWQSYEEYMAGRPARLRSTISRKKRKLEREQGYEIRLFTGNEVPEAMPDYHTVYAASWKASEQYSGFTDGMAVGYSRQGWTRLALLYIRGKPTAAQLWFVTGGKASIFRLAYDENWRRYSPGSILTAYMMKYVIDTDRVQEVDFLIGNEAYKQDWMSERSERWALSCVRSGPPVSRSGFFIDYLKSVFKRW